MEVMVAVQSGTLLHALRKQLKRRVSARRGGDYIWWWGVVVSSSFVCGALAFLFIISFSLRALSSRLVRAP
jgi:hypothetical protein